MSELTIEQKAKLYDEVVERAKKWYNTPNVDKIPTFGNRIIEDIFPELYEPKDEEVRKEIIKLVQYYYGATLGCKHTVSRDKMLVWLEKQEQSKKTSIWKHWKNGIAGNGEGKLTFLIKSGPTYSLSSCLSFECDYIELSELDNLMLEEQDNFNSEYWRGYREGKQEVFDKYAKLKKQSKQNIKPKFKIGDWVTNGACTWRIDSIKDDMYYNDCGRFSCGGDIKSIDEQYHLWTIEDAKPGDVLNANGIFIYKKHDKDCVYFYCGINLTGEFICTCVDDIWSNNYKVYPATKEQYDLLFKKIQESGYEWDTEKKMLKNIPKFKAGDWIIFNGLTLYINEVVKGYYRTISKGGISNSYDWNIDNAARLWTIEDAREGDVLWHSNSASNGIFIFNKIRDTGKVVCYCDYDSEDHFCLGEYHTCCWSNEKYIKPATEEQRNLLFTKMKEAGYRWDENAKRVIKYGE